MKTRAKGADRAIDVVFEVGSVKVFSVVMRATDSAAASALLKENGYRMLTVAEVAAINNLSPGLTEGAERIPYREGNKNGRVSALVVRCSGHKIDGASVKDVIRKD